MAKRAAIILAGGRSKRFQVKGERWRDKALARLFGKPLLIHVVEKVSGVVEEIIVCVNEGARKRLYSEVLRKYSVGNVKFCVDEKSIRVEGPIRGIATGLKSASADYCVVLPCDIPLIQPSVVDYLFKVAEGSNVTVPVWPDGRLESLMAVYERKNVIQITDALCRLGRRRPDDIIRGGSKVTFVSTVGDLKSLDPEFRSFVNVNFREDLARLPTRVVENGSMKESLRLNLGSPNASQFKLLMTASERYRRGRFLEASNMFSFLSTRLESGELNFWAAISREKEGDALFGLSGRQGDVKMRRDYYVKGKAAFMKAMENYVSEAEVYGKNQIDFLAKRARADGLWCQRRVNNFNVVKPP